MSTKNDTKKGLASFSLYAIAFTVENIENSIKWYRDVLGFSLIANTTFTAGDALANVAIMSGGGIHLEMLQMPGAKRIDELFAEPPKHLIPIGNKAIVLQVEDLAVASRELEEKKVTFIWREKYLVGDKMLGTLIRDIDGNLISIFQADTVITSH